MTGRCFGIKHLKNLTNLSIHGCDKVTAKHLTKEYLPKLERIHCSSELRDSKEVKELAAQGVLVDDDDNWMDD